MSKPAHEFKTVSFPECAKDCAAVEYLGVCECESVCPWKFDKDGNPVKGIIHDGTVDTAKFLKEGT